MPGPKWSRARGVWRRGVQGASEIITAGSCRHEDRSVDHTPCEINSRLWHFCTRDEGRGGGRARAAVSGRKRDRGRGTALRVWVVGGRRESAGGLKSLNSCLPVYRRDVCPKLFLEAVAARA